MYRKKTKRYYRYKDETNNFEGPKMTTVNGSLKIYLGNPFGHYPKITPQKHTSKKLGNDSSR